jgi:hypothetical protein
MTSFALSRGDFLNGYFGKKQPGLKNFVQPFFCLCLGPFSLVFGFVRSAVSHLKPNLTTLNLHMIEYQNEKQYV